MLFKKKSVDQITGLSDRMSFKTSLENVGVSLKTSYSVLHNLHINNTISKLSGQNDLFVKTFLCSE